MGQRITTSRGDSDVLPDVLSPPPSPSSASSSSSISVSSISISSELSTAAIQQPVPVQQEERDTSTQSIDVVHSTQSIDQEPSVHYQPSPSSSDEDGTFTHVKTSSLKSCPSPSRPAKPDDAQLLTRRGSMAPPKLARFRPSMDMAKSLSVANYESSSDSRSLDSSSSSSDEDLVGSGDELVNDWLDEPEDAVLSPPSLLKRARHASACSSVSSHTGNISVSFSAMHSSGGRNSNSSQHSMTGWASWLSSPDDVEEEDDADDEAVALTPFLRENMPVYEIMRQVQLFRNLSQMQQEQVVRALKPAKFSDGDVIVAQGT